MPQLTESALPHDPDSRLEPLPTPGRRQPPRDYALCRHIKTTGHRCGSPALRGEHFCYFHHTARRPPKHLGVHPDHAVFTFPLIEDGPSILSALADVLARVAADSLNPRRAALLIHGLRIACIAHRLTPTPAAAPSPRLTRASRHNLSSWSAAEGSASACPLPLEVQEEPPNHEFLPEIIQEIILDPDLGPIAPIAYAELLAPPAPAAPAAPAPATPAPDPYQPEPPEPGRTEPGYSPEHMDRILRRLGFPHIPAPSAPVPPTAADYFDPRPDSVPNPDSPTDSVIPALQAVADPACLTPSTLHPPPPRPPHVSHPRHGGGVAP